MKRLGKQDILAAKDRYYEDVESEAWGGIVRIAVITGTDRDRFEAITYPMKGKEIKVNREDIRARLLSLAIVDENLERVFTDDEVRELGKKSAKELDRLFGIAQRINGMTDDSVKELEKN